MPTFFAPTKLILDVSVPEAVRTIVRDEGWARIGVIVDEQLMGQGLVNQVEDEIRRLTQGFQLIEQTVSEPDTEYTDQVCAQLRSIQPEALIGIGGGSVLDVTKAVAVLLTNPQKAADYQGFDLVRNPGLPTVAIPTTAGTGSEVTWTAVLTNREKGLKAGINSPHLFPKYAVLDAALTTSMPRRLTITTAMDAIAHAVESYTAKSASAVSRAISKEAFRLLFSNIRAVIGDGSDLEARRQMLLGSTLAGWAIVNAGTGACHSVAYALGTLFNVPHGAANAMLLPKVMQFNEDRSPGLYADLLEAGDARHAGLTQTENSQKLAMSLQEIMELGGLTDSLSDFGASLEDIDHVAAKGLELKSALSNNPVAFDYEAAREVVALII
jgi:alcohol dehydrogenase class IV